MDSGLIGAGTRLTSGNQVIIIGDAMVDHQFWIDHLPQPGEDTIILSSMNNVGGSGANTAIALAYLGTEAKFFGTIGHDRDGELILDQMRAVGVDYSGMQFGETTGFTLTMIDNKSERTMYSFRGASSKALEHSDVLMEGLRASRVLLTSGYQLLQDDQAAVAISSAERVRAAGNLVALDPCPLIGLVRPEVRARMLALTDILLPNQLELSILIGEQDLTKALERAKDLAPCTAIKIGSRGSKMYLRKGFQLANGRQLAEDIEVWEPALKVTAVDTTGAGDSFNAGFLASYLRNEEPLMWLRSGNRLASEVVQHSGAVTMFCKTKTE